jgi:hypothetical protein
MTIEITDDITFTPLADGDYRLRIVSETARELFALDYPVYLDRAELTADECDDLIEVCRYEHLTANGWRFR